MKCSFRNIYIYGRSKCCVVAMIVFEFMTISLNDYLLSAVCLQDECAFALYIRNREVQADNVALLCEIWHTTRQTGAHAILCVSMTIKMDFIGTIWFRTSQTLQ